MFCRQGLTACQCHGHVIMRALQARHVTQQATIPAIPDLHSTWHDSATSGEQLSSELRESQIGESQSVLLQMSMKTLKFQLPQAWVAQCACLVGSRVGWELTACASAPFWGCVLPRDENLEPSKSCLSPPWAPASKLSCQRSLGIRCLCLALVEADTYSLNRAAPSWFVRKSEAA